MSFNVSQGNPQKLLSSVGSEIAYFYTKNQRAVIGYSATAYFPLAFDSHVFGSICFYLPDTSDLNSVQISFSPLYYNSEPIVIPAKNRRERENNFNRFCDKYLEFLPQLFEKLNRESPSRNHILLALNSYNDCFVFNSIAMQSRTNRNFNIKVILKSQDHLFTQVESIISPSEIEEYFKQLDDKSPTLLVAPIQIISRGYNILNRQEESSFGLISIGSRNMPPMDSIESIILFANYFSMKNFVESPLLRGKNPYAGYNKNLEYYRRQISRYKNCIMPFSNIQDEEVKQGILANSLVQDTQLIGRGRRGKLKPSSIQLLLHDGAFQQKKKNVLHKYLENIGKSQGFILLKNMHLPIIKKLEAL